jgi:hypothetical protein
MKPRAADLLTVDQAAALLLLTPASVRHHCRRGTLPARRLAGVWLIRRADAARFVRRPAGRPRKVKG